MTNLVGCLPEVQAVLWILDIILVVGFVHGLFYWMSNRGKWALCLVVLALLLVWDIYLYRGAC